MFYFESFSTQCFLVYDTHIHMLAHIYLSCGCVMHWFDSQKFLYNALTGAVQYQSYQHSHPEQKGICNVSSAKSFPFSINCSCKLVVSSHTGSATVFLLKLICENACFLSGHMTWLTLTLTLTLTLHKLPLSKRPGWLNNFFGHNWLTCAMWTWSAVTLESFLTTLLSAVCHMLVFILVFCLIVPSYFI